MKDTKNYPEGNWQLFNIENDPAEMTDLSASMPEISNELREKVMSLHNKYPTVERSRNKNNKKKSKKK